MAKTKNLLVVTKARNFDHSASLAVSLVVSCTEVSSQLGYTVFSCEFARWRVVLELDTQLGWFRSGGINLRGNLDFKVKRRFGVKMVSESLSLYQEGVVVGCGVLVGKVCVIDECVFYWVDEPVHVGSKIGKCSTGITGYTE